MCLSTVYMSSKENSKEIMKDVAQVLADGKGFWIIDLLGEKRFVNGVIESIDLMDNYMVLRSEKE